MMLIVAKIEGIDGKQDNQKARDDNILLCSSFPCRSIVKPVFSFSHLSFLIYAICFRFPRRDLSVTNL